MLLVSKYDPAGEELKQLKLQPSAWNSIVEEIKFRLPFEGRAALMRSEMQITLGIGKGNAKPTNDVKKGDISAVKKLIRKNRLILKTECNGIFLGV